MRLVSNSISRGNMLAATAAGGLINEGVAIVTLC